MDLGSCPELLGEKGGKALHREGLKKYISK